MELQLGRSHRYANTGIDSKERCVERGESRTLIFRERHLDAIKYEALILFLVVIDVSLDTTCRCVCETNHQHPSRVLHTRIPILTSANYYCSSALLPQRHETKLEVLFMK